MKHHTPPPLPPIDCQELARRNNEAAEAHRQLEARRLLRSKLKDSLVSSHLRLAAKLRKALEKAEPKPTPRPARAVGFFLPGKP